MRCKTVDQHTDIRVNANRFFVVIHCVTEMWVIIAERLICAMTMAVTSHQHAFTASLLLIACSKCLHSLMEEKKIS